MALKEKNIRQLSTIIIVFLSFCFLFPVFRLDIPLYSTFTDDFFYYLQIASNYNKGLGFSFTPGIATNGFQPLYQWLIIILVYLADLIQVNELVFIKVVLSIIFFLSSFLLQKI